MKTATRGNEAEAVILASLVERGFEVLVPFGGGQPYDLVVDLGGFDLLKVQCKTGWHHKGCISFNARSTDHGQGRRPYIGLAHRFAADYEIDRWSLERLLEIKREAEVAAEPELNFA
ncbi:MAG: group I intron-associated PD-(D/E)XK endonuclease [Solirubrobacterales bacterium]